MFVLKNKPLFIGLSLICTVLYLYFGYMFQRSDFLLLLILESLLFLSTYKLIKSFGNNFKLLTGLGIFFRLLFLFSIPNLSQDFFRFIWDGNLVINGVNPYMFTPKMYFDTQNIFIGIPKNQAQVLYEGMGLLNGSHYSNYPPVNQFFFAVANWLGGKNILGNVVVMRLLIILADIGILYFGKKLLVALHQKPTTIFWYFLNPFILIEMTGNLHFEPVMLFFLIWALYLIKKQKWIFGAVIFGLSISVKLIPLLFLPLFFKWFYTNEIGLKGLYHLVLFYVIVLATVIATFIPFYTPEFLSHFLESIALWFQNFEFNASIYYIIRWIGYQTIGWNIIATTGKILPLVVVFCILLFTFIRKNNRFKNLLESLLFSISIYLLLATTVHPWYLATPLLLSVFTNYRYMVVWSFVVVFSYAAYANNPFQENLIWVALEYFIVIGYFVWEYKKIKTLKLNHFKGV